MALERVRALLTEENARFVSHKDAPLLFQRELVRNWPMESDALVEEGIRYLNSLDYRWVDDPQANRKKFEGRWRRVSADRYTYDSEAQINAQSGISETLRYGFAESLDWTESRILRFSQTEGNGSQVAGIANSQSDDPENFLFVEFTNLNPATAPALANSFAETVTDPVIRNVTYSGLWHKISAVVLESDLERDGSVKIQLLLARPQYTLRAYERFVRLYNGQQRAALVYYLWNVPKDLAQGILDAFQTTAKSAGASLTGDNMVNLVLTDDYFHPLYGMYSDRIPTGGACAWDTETWFYWGVYDPTASVYALSNFYDFRTSGVTYRRTIDFDKNTGTFDMTITRQETRTRRYDPYVSMSNSQFYDTTYLEKGVRDGMYFTVPFYPPQGQVYNQNAQPNDDCSSDIATTWRISKPDDFYIAWLSDGLVNGMWGFANRRAVPTDITSTLVATNNNDVSVSLQEDKTYSGLVRTQPQWGTIQGYANFYYSVLTLGKFEQQEYVEGSGDQFWMKPYDSLWAILHYVTYHATEAQAYQSSTSNANSLGSPSVSSHGAVWRCDRVVAQIRVKEHDASADPGIALTGFPASGFFTVDDATFYASS